MKSASLRRPPGVNATATVSFDRPGLVGVLVLTTTIQSLVAFVALTPPVFAQAALPDLGLHPAALGFYIGVVYLAAAVTSLLGGGGIRRLGAMGLSLLCLALAALGLGGLALGGEVGPGSAAAVLAGGAALVIGLGYGPVTPASSQLLARVVPAHRRALVFSIKQTGVPLGGMAAGALVPGLTLWLGWQAAALVVAALCLGVALIALPARWRLDRGGEGEEGEASITAGSAQRDGEARDGEVRDSEARDGRIGGNPGGGSDPGRPLRRSGVGSALALIAGPGPLRPLAAVSFVYAAMQLILSTFLVMHLTTAGGLGLVAAGGVLSLAQLAGALARVLWGWVADRFAVSRGVLVLLGVGASLGALGMGMVSPAWPGPAVTLLAMLWGATAVGWNGVFLAEVAACAPPGQAGAATGAALFFTYAGVVAGPPLFGLLQGAMGARAAFFAFAGLCLMTALGLLVGSRRPHRPGAGQKGG